MADRKTGEGRISKPKASEMRSTLQEKVLLHFGSRKKLFSGYCNPRRMKVETKTMRIKNNELERAGHAAPEEKGARVIWKKIRKKCSRW